MRKGRSQRKTRGSLPISKRAPSRLDGAISGGSGGPQVVVGLTAPLTESVEGALDPRPAQTEASESLETRARGSEHLELVAQHATQEPAQTEEPAHAEAPAAVESRVETLTFDARDPFQDEREEATAEATPAPAPTPTPARQMSLPTPDEMSIPPAGDLSVEPIADRFFSEGELAASSGIDHDLHHEDWDQRAHTSVRKSLPEVVQRRARFAKYVRWAVSGAAVVCLAALARSVVPATPVSASLATVGPRESQSQSGEAPVAKAAAAAVVAAEPAKAPESVAAPVVAVPAAAPAAPEAPAAPSAVDPPAKGAPAAPPAADAPAAAASDKTALQEKNDARRALERGKLGDAIAAGERSVALDPADGEAWLLLGAAYQEKGKNADARRCYTACTKEGKRGPVGECRAMLR